MLFLVSCSCEELLLSHKGKRLSFGRVAIGAGGTLPGDTEHGILHM